MRNYTEKFSADAMRQRNDEAKDYRVIQGLVKYSTELEGILDSIVAEANEGKRLALIGNNQLNSPDGFLRDAAVYLLFSPLSSGGLGYLGEATDVGLCVRW